MSPGLILQEHTLRLRVSGSDPPVSMLHKLNKHYTNNDKTCQRSASDISLGLLGHPGSCRSGTYIHILIYIHTYIRTYMCVCVCVCVETGAC